MKLIFISILLFILSINIALSAGLVETDGHKFSVNNFLDDSQNKLGLLIPALLLALTLITFAIDFGTVGVSFASVASLLILYFIGIIYINPINLISFIIIIGIMIYKMQG